MKTTPLILLLVLSVFQSSQAIENKIAQSQAVEIELYNDEVNADSQVIRVRDADSGKIAQVQIQKVGNKNNSWNGSFIIQFFNGDNSSRSLEFSSPDGSNYFIYVPQTKNPSQKIYLFKDENDYNKFVQADMARLKKVQEAQAPVAPAKTRAEVMSPQKMRKLEQQVREQSRVQEQTQLSIEEAQAKARAEMIEKQRLASAAEKQKRKDLAKSASEKADALYSKQQYASANKLYAEASSLDPENESYYYRYGVSLYKSNDYNKSLAVLSLAEAPEGKSLEKDYYVALNHLKLRDYDKAKKKFTEIRSENNPDLSPISSFFAGNIEIQTQKFTEARKSMEYVIDNSKDPALDRAADAALERIDKLEAYYMSKKEKYRFSVFTGFTYDQNVLNISSNNVSTDTQAYRFNYGASALGIWYRTPNSDFGTQISVSDYYSLNNQFQADATIQTADPLEISLTLPYHLESSVWGRQYNFEIIPYAKSIIMSQSGVSRKELIRSYGSSFAASTALSGTWFLSNKLDVSSDQSFLSSSTGDDNQNATKVGLTVAPTRLLDLKGEQSITPEVSYLMNMAQGKNYRYKKFGLAGTYAFPLLKTNSSLRLDYTNQNYSEASTTRTDITAALTFSMSKDLKKDLNLVGSAQYTTASSDLDIYKYNKFMISALLTYTTSIFSK